LGKPKNLQPDLHIIAEFQTESLLPILAFIFPSTFDSFKLQGLLRIAGNVSGTWITLPHLDATLQCTSAAITIQDIPLTDFSSTWTFKNSILTSNDIRFDLFDGLSSAAFTCDTSQKSYRFSWESLSNQINLNTLLNTFSDNEGEFKGDLDFALDLQGVIGKPDSIKGFGSLQLANGRLWSLPVMSGIPLLGSIPFLGKSPITDGNGAFFIQDRHIYSDGLRFWGKSIEASVIGSIDFDKTLDLYVDITQTRNALVKIPFIGSVGIIPGVHIEGTLEKPQYRIIAVKKTTSPQTEPEVAPTLEPSIEKELLQKLPIKLPFDIKKFL